MRILSFTYDVKCPKVDLLLLRALVQYALA